MATPLEDRVALVTAGSAGLGKATAHALASMRMKVVINYSENIERAEQVIKELRKMHKSDDGRTRFVAIKADVSKRSEVKRLMQQTIAEMGRLDVVFSNHGWTKPTHFTNLDDNVNEEDWDRCFNMNVKSHLFLMHSAREHLEATKGTFITTASTAGVMVSGSSVAYAVTKAAQIHLVKCLAVIASPNIRVNCVSPSMMLTDWSAAFAPAKKDAAVEKTKLGRLVKVEDVAEQVCCFVKSQSITGENVVLDCGARL